MTISSSTIAPPISLSHLPLDSGFIARLIGTQRLYIFLDYDGTLTPIVPIPADAILSSEMRCTIVDLADTFPVGIITGRGCVAIRHFLADDVVAKVSLAASHGFDIRMQNGKTLHVGDNNQMSNFRRFKENLKACLNEFPAGCCVEETGYSASLHYRNVKREEWALVESMLDSLISRYAGLVRKDGKMVFETRIDVDWNKGKAIEYILSNTIRPNESLDDIFIIYVGDDITDEDGFHSVNKYPNHLSLIVCPDEEIGRPTDAEYRVCDPNEVRDFLQILISLQSDKFSSSC
jgi:trehalose 6-phosphate phosphatase